MIKWLMRRQIAAYDKIWNYDSSYIREILDADMRALLIFGKVTGIGNYRKDVPLAPYYAAKIAAVMSEDCGPCTQLVIDMAQKEGVDPAVIRAVVARDVDAMSDDVALAVGFAEATLNHAPEADAKRDAVVDCWGKRGLISLAFGMTAARIYPTVKYAMGHGHACMRLTVGGETRPVLRTVDKAA